MNESFKTTWMFTSISGMNLMLSFLWPFQTRSRSTHLLSMITPSWVWNCTEMFTPMSRTCLMLTSLWAFKHGQSQLASRYCVSFLCSICQQGCSQTEFHKKIHKRLGTETPSSCYYYMGAYFVILEQCLETFLKCLAVTTLGPGLNNNFCIITSNHLLNNAW